MNNDNFRLNYCIIFIPITIIVILILNIKPLTVITNADAATQSRPTYDDNDNNNDANSNDDDDDDDDEDYDDDGDGDDDDQDHDHDHDDLRGITPNVSQHVFSKMTPAPPTQPVTFCTKCISSAIVFGLPLRISTFIHQDINSQHIDKLVLLKILTPLAVNTGWW